MLLQQRLKHLDEVKAAGALRSNYGKPVPRAKTNEKNQSDAGTSSDRNWRSELNYEELPLSNFFVTMLQKLGVETDSFTDSTGTLAEV